MLHEKISDGNIHIMTINIILKISMKNNVICYNVNYLLLGLNASFQPDVDLLYIYLLFDNEI